jgi:hypothetical protein
MALATGNVHTIMQLHECGFYVVLSWRHADATSDTECDDHPCLMQLLAVCLEISDLCAMA